MSALTIRKGTQSEWKRSRKNPNDIVFMTDIPIIMSQGQAYGVPTWENEDVNKDV